MRVSRRVALLATGIAAALAAGGVAVALVDGTASAAPVTRAAPGAATAVKHVWHPAPGNVAWQWELDHPLNLRSASDLGLHDRTYQGRPAAVPTIYDIDGFDNPAGTVAALHRRGAHVICYVEVGAAENYRPDYGKFPRAALGDTVPSYPKERYLDIRNKAVLAVIKARIAMCAAKGFDAVEPDIDDSYSVTTGFPLTEAEQVGYDATLSRYAHSLGLAWGLKNGDDAGFAHRMLPNVDFVLDEQCFQYSTCGAFSPAYPNADKLVLVVEYQDQGGPAPRQYCPTALRERFAAVMFRSALDGTYRVTCG